MSGSKKSIALATFMAAVLLGFLSVYQLTESPPTWFDEGHLIQVAMNAAFHGPHAMLQIAPGHYASGAYSETSGYPVTFAVAAAFRLFGTNLLVARSVMVVFIASFVFCAWKLMRREMPLYLATYALGLIVTFAPLYGNGKNVLGEVPGLLFLIVFLLCVKRIESRRVSSLPDFLFAGLFLGLAVATKPIFLLVLLPVAVAIAYSRRLLTPVGVVAGVGACAAAVFVWVWVQFGDQTLGQVVAFYANPFHITLATAALHNALLFVSAVQPLYALVLLGVWTLSMLLRIRSREPISRTEYIAMGFTLLVYIAFLRMTPFYRYFFVGEVFALLYLPFSLHKLWPQKVPIFFFHALLALLIAFQTYQCFFSSWVATHYGSHRTAELGEVLGRLSTSTSIFVYQVPEAVLFLPPGMPFYQYFMASPIVSIGDKDAPLISQGVPEYVLFEQDALAPPDLSQYHEVKAFDHYLLWRKN